VALTRLRSDRIPGVVAEATIPQSWKEKLERIWDFMAEGDRRRIR
jgi:hypothetical protein